jgi:hypothetical protein
MFTLPNGDCDGHAGLRGKPGSICCAIGDEIVLRIGAG